MKSATNDADEIADAAIATMRELRAAATMIRGLGVSCSKLDDAPSAATAHVAALQSAGMQLAGRAVLLYLNHAVLAKQHGRLSRPPAVAFGASTPELRAQASALRSIFFVPGSRARRGRREIVDAVGRVVAVVS